MASYIVGITGNLGTVKFNDGVRVGVAPKQRFSRVIAVIGVDFNAFWIFIC